MNLVGFVFRLALRLLLLGMALAFALGLLLVGLASLVWVLLKALVTGRKPAFIVTLQRFQQARHQFRRGGWSTTGRPGPNSGGGDVVDVVDVEAMPVDATDASASDIKALAPPDRRQP